MHALHFMKLSPVKYIPPTQAKAHRGQKPVEALIEIAILSDKISPRHRFTNRVAISLGQVRCLFKSAPLAYNEAVLLLLRCLEDKMASQRWLTLPAAAGNSCQKQRSMRENTHTQYHELCYCTVYWVVFYSLQSNRAQHMQ